jgi:3-hydroxyacyl-CoA dehydrogenase
MTIKNVTVCGSGVLGGQIAFQTAYHGFNVVVYDIEKDLLEKAKGKFIELGEAFKKDLSASQQELDSAIARISFTTDLAIASLDADLVIEAIPENLTIKKDFYSKLGKVAPEKTIFCTNTSTLLPSQFAQETGRPERFLALHFANQIWKQNTAEVMAHADTDPSVFDKIVDFAKSIGMVALPLYKEHPGYILNTLLPALLNAAYSLVLGGVTDPYTVDKTWMIATGSPIPPFAGVDIIGMNTPYFIALQMAEQGDLQAKALADYLKINFIDKGKLGVSTGEGFYKYPNPAYQNSDFLKQ